MTLFKFPGLGSKEGEQWLLTEKGQFVHVTGSVHVKDLPVVEVTQNGQKIRDELLAFSRSVVAATAKAAV